MRRTSSLGSPQVRFALAVAALVAVEAVVACSASSDSTASSGFGGMTTTTSTMSKSSAGGSGGATSVVSSTVSNFVTVSSSGGTGGTFVNPCGNGCGGVELCDPDHLGLDDNCDGQVDEGCQCNDGQAHFCFKGDSSYRGTPGCYDGTELCSELGIWGPCEGGVHATDDCFANDTSACHAISATPFATVDLKDGTGTFSGNAIAGSETYTVMCPSGNGQCPMVNGETFQPLVSGEYTVTYTKSVEDGGTETCTFPLIVGARGLRVELDWEHDLGGTGVDLDLHLHAPLTDTPWSVGGATNDDCMYSNCTADGFGFGSGPTWFTDTAMPPDPVNWYLDPTMDNNTCYFAPHGHGQTWQDLGMGCHNPRLDSDDIDCDPTIMDPDDFEFCAPENTNVDFPPKNQWMRIGVHYYGSHDLTYDVHPVIKIYCNGELAAELGDHGYYTPEDVLTFTPDMGDSGSGTGDKRIFWAVADVAFLNQDQCNPQSCVVQPLYGDATTKTPLLTFTETAEANFGPSYPPPPQ